MQSTWPHWCAVLYPESTIELYFVPTLSHAPKMHPHNVSGGRGYCWARNGVIINVGGDTYSTAMGCFGAQAIPESCLKCNQVAKDVHITASMCTSVHFVAGTCIKVHTCNK